MLNRRSTWLTALPALLALAPACSAERTTPTPAPTFDGDVGAVFAAKCDACHGAESPAAGYRTTSYLGAIGCYAPDAGSSDGDAGDAGTSAAPVPATVPPGDEAPLLKVLSTPDHAALLTDDERALVTSWVKAGAPAFRGWVHDASFIDPRSPNFHARYLRAQKWRPMLDGTDVNACGRCHDGTPARPVGKLFGAPEAPACTTCHTDPGGPLACGTCHGDGASRAMPPRDPCFFPEGPHAGAHAVHVQGDPKFVPAGFACSTCHPVPGTDPSKPVLSGSHGDGTVDIQFDPKRAGNDAKFDPATFQCTVACHAQGGHRGHPQWFDPRGGMTCNDCHRAPPAYHYQGKCSFCHHTANDDGTALVDTSKHLNGKIDLGNGSGGCGACHGDGVDDPWPHDGAHPSHRAPDIAAAAVACTSCHVVPKDVHDPGHLNRDAFAATLTFSGPAVARGVTPSWNGTSCKDVACHGGGLPGVIPAEPVWKDASGTWKECGACHSIPPPTPHTALTTCESAACHGAEVLPTPTGPSINPAHRDLHVNGSYDLKTP